MLDFVANTQGIVVDDGRPKDVYQVSELKKKFQYQANTHVIYNYKLLENALIKDLARFDCEATLEYLVGKVESIVQFSVPEAADVTVHHLIRQMIHSK